MDQVRSAGALHSSQTSGKSRRSRPLRHLPPPGRPSDNTRRTCSAAVTFPAAATASHSPPSPTHHLRLADFLSSQSPAGPPYSLIHRAARTAAATLRLSSAFLCQTALRAASRKVRRPLARRSLAQPGHETGKGRRAHCMTLAHHAPISATALPGPHTCSLLHPSAPTALAVMTGHRGAPLIPNRGPRAPSM